MKVRIELTDNCTEEEVVIHCGSLSEEVVAIQNAIAEITSGKKRFSFTGRIRSIICRWSPFSF